MQLFGQTVRMEIRYLSVVVFAVQLYYCSGFSLTKLHDDNVKTLDTNADVVRKLLTEMLSASLNSDSPCLYENEIKSAIETFIHESQPNINENSPEDLAESPDYPQTGGDMRKRFYSDWKRR